MAMVSRRLKRSSPRFSTGIHARLRIGEAGHTCRVHDLSRTGALLEGRLPRAEGGERVEVILSDPTGNLEVALSARIARVDRVGAGETRIAVAFDTPADDAQRQLEALVSRVLEARTVVPLDDLPENAAPAEIRRALASIPLAHRVALATKGKPRERQLLLLDTHPNVLEALARNPNLAAPEARELAKLRHLLATTLELLARDRRWRDDEDIKVAIATHHRVPVPLADSLLSEMKPPALRKALASPSLNDALRRKILYWLAHPGRS